MAPVPPFFDNKLHSLDVSWKHLSNEGSSNRKMSSLYPVWSNSILTVVKQFIWAI